MLRQVRDVAAMKQEQDIIKIVISAQGWDPGNLKHDIKGESAQ